MYMLDSRGQVYSLGDAEGLGSVAFSEDVARDLLVTPKADGYVILDSFGDAYSFGLAPLVRFATEPMSMPSARDLEFSVVVTEIERKVVRELSDKDAQADLTSDWVVWSNPNDDENGRDLFIYDIVHGTSDVLVSELEAQVAPSIDGDRVVYTTLQNGKKEIYSLILSETGSATEITPLVTEAQVQEQPDLDNEVIAWSAASSPDFSFDVWIQELDGGDAVKLTPNTPFTQERSPSLAAYPVGAEDRVFVAWERWKNNASDLFLYEGAADETDPSAISANTRLIRGGVGDQYQPVLKYPWLVYTEAINGVFNVRLYSLISGEDIALTDLAILQWQPVIGDDFFAWIDRRNEGWDVFELNMFKGEARLSTGFQIIDSLAASGDNLVWVEFAQSKWRLMLYRPKVVVEQPPFDVIR